MATINTALGKWARGGRGEGKSRESGVPKLTKRGRAKIENTRELNHWKIAAEQKLSDFLLSWFFCIFKHMFSQRNLCIQSI